MWKVNYPKGLEAGGSQESLAGDHSCWTIIGPYGSQTGHVVALEECLPGRHLIDHKPGAIWALIGVANCIYKETVHMSLHSYAPEIVNDLCRFYFTLDLLVS